MPHPPTAQQHRPRALAELGLNNFYNPENELSSDDEPFSQARGIRENEAQSVVGVSLGPEQKRLLSPRTPALEKASAIEATGDFFVEDSPLLDEDLEPPQKKSGGPQSASDGQADGRPAGGQDSATPTPAEAKRVAKTDDHRSALKNIGFLRRRADSGPSLLEGWHRSLMSTLPKSLPFSGSGRKNSPDASLTSQRARSYSVENLLSRIGRGRGSDDASPTAEGSRLGQVTNSSEQSNTEDHAEDRLPDLPTLSHRTSHLRRWNSDESLRVGSVLSRTSTLGDDSRFEDVKEMVNSRKKAIKDSLQDSNIKLPSFSSLTSLSLESFRPDFTFTNWHGNSKGSLTSTNTEDSNRAARGSLSPTPAETAKNVLSVGSPMSGGPASKIATSHPHFTKACAEATGDIVVLGGYRGSILRSAEPPHRQLWVPVKVGLNIRKVDMEVGLNVPEDDAATEEKIIPDCMLSHIGPVDITRRLFKRLRACHNAKSGLLRVHDYGYDWRLDPEYLSQRLIKYLEKLPCNQPGTPQTERGATVLAHSLGGLITRHAINKRPELFAGVVYAGTPTTCVNILGPLRNGDDVLLSSRVLTAQVNFTIRTSFALLPLDGECFFNKETGERFPVDFFDPQTWIDYRLSPCVARPLPALSPPPSGVIDNLRSSISSALPSVRSSSGASKAPNGTQDQPSSPNGSGPGAFDSGQLEPSNMDHAPTGSIATAVTIPRDQAIAYLTNMLARVKRFKENTSHRPDHQAANLYPPAAVIFGKSTPTVYGAKVRDRESIKHADAYDNLAFGSGDGVVLARASMLPDGYEVARGGVVSSERGHITLLGDLEAVGRAMNAVRRSRARGTGTGIAPTA